MGHKAWDTGFPMEIYFIDSPEMMYTDFKIWCEDNIDTINEAVLLEDICEEVNYIADKLFDA